MNEQMSFSEEIKQQALALGFDACGICRAGDSGEEDRYLKWIGENCHGGMDYLARNIDKESIPDCWWTVPNPSSLWH